MSEVRLKQFQHKSDRQLQPRFRAPYTQNRQSAVHGSIHAPGWPCSCLCVGQSDHIRAATRYFA